MKVILKQTVPKVGKEGQVVNVADGFARNFLFPKRLAVMADKASIAALEREHAKIESQIEETRSAAEKLGEKIAGETIRITGSTAKGSIKLFGAVTSADIADALKEQVGVEVDKRQVALMHPIKRLGVYDVLIDLHRHVEASVRLEVANEEGFLGIEEVEKPAEEEEAGEEVATEPVEEAAVETEPVAATGDVVEGEEEKT